MFPSNFTTHLKAGLTKVLFLTAVVSATAAAQIPSEFDDKRLNREIDLLLRTRDVGMVSADLARPESSSMREQLKAVVIFSRAGHRERLRTAVQRLSESALPEENVDRHYINNIVRAAIEPEDLTTLRIFYERFAPWGDHRSDEFVNTWRDSGDEDGLERWLWDRADKWDTWWEHLYRLLYAARRTEELAPALEKQIRSRPGTRHLVQKYVRVAGGRDLTWLSDSYLPNTRFGAYELASIVSHYAPQMAIDLLQRSLALPFTKTDESLFSERAFMMASVRPLDIVAEKQLRYWTLSLLVRISNDHRRSDLGQIYAEQLTSMDTTGIQAVDSFGMAGTAQVQSGQRVIESRILEKEVTDRELPDYWINRARYYKGRNEPDLVIESLVQALSIFQYASEDKKTIADRILILREMAWTSLPADQTKIKRKLITDELSRSIKKDQTYQFSLMSLAIRDLAEDVATHAMKTDALPEILKARSQWGQEEARLISAIMKRDIWDEEQSLATWDRLFKLAMYSPTKRGYWFAQAIRDEPGNLHHLAIPLLEECRKVATADYSEEKNFTLTDIERLLFKIYLSSGNWKKAREMYVSGYSYWGSELNEIALAAAQAGDYDEAVKTWELVMRLDRRKLSRLDDLAKTPARVQLVDLYVRMRDRDPYTNVPAKALAILSDQ